ncbi:MAG TPA: hypothetical protein VE057_21395 [Archangium sp.]|nr:hypothetical protein [Archangium sp.]
MAATLVCFSTRLPAWGNILLWGLLYFLAERVLPGLGKDESAVKLKDRRQEEGENLPAVQALIDEHSVHAFPSFAIVMPDGKRQRLTRGYNGYTGTLQFLLIPTPSGP